MVFVNNDNQITSNYVKYPSPFLYANSTTNMTEFEIKKDFFKGNPLEYKIECSNVDDCTNEISL